MNITPTLHEIRLEYLSPTHVYARDTQGTLLYEFVFDNDANISQHTWYVYALDEQIKQVYYAISKHIASQNFPRTKSLSDFSQVDGSFAGINDWLVEVYMPKAIEAGLRYLAMVVSDDFYIDLSLDDYFEKSATLSIAQRRFHDKETALAWLKNGI